MANEKASFLRRDATSSFQEALRRCALSAAVAGLAAFGCGTPAVFVVTAPSSAIADSPFTLTVTAMVGKSRDTVINSSIQFTSSDKAAVLPPVYYFTAADAGSHTFTGGITLNTPGTQSITVTDIAEPGLNGSASVTVMVPPAVGN